MNSKDFISLQRRLSLDIVSSKSSDWVINDVKIAINSPSLESTEISKQDISKLFSRGIKAAVFKSDHCKDYNSAEYLYKGDSYLLEDFTGKIRNQIKKGLKSCTIKKPKLSDLIRYGVAINQEILSNHKRNVEYLTNLESWEKYISTMYETNDIYFYGAYVDETLIGYIVFIKVEKKYYIYHPYSTRKYSKYAPMNALLYTAINEFILADKEVIVTYGLSSFFSKPGLDRFKKGMRFVEEKTCRALAINKPYSFFMNSLFFKLANKLASINRLTILCEKYIIIYNAFNIYKKIVNE